MVKRPTCSEPITLETCKSEPAEDVQGCSSEMLPFAASCEPICVADVLKQHRTVKRGQPVGVKATAHTLRGTGEPAEDVQEAQQPFGC